MDAADKKKRKHRYNIANNILFFGSFIVFPLLNQCTQISEITFLIILLVFTAVSGVVAYLHSKLPKEMQEKPNWFQRSAFGVHPYVTFLIFIVLTLMISASIILPKLY